MSLRFTQRDKWSSSQSPPLLLFWIDKSEQSSPLICFCFPSLWPFNCSSTVFSTLSAEWPDLAPKSKLYICLLTDLRQQRQKIWALFFNIQNSNSYIRLIRAELFCVFPRPNNKSMKSREIKIKKTDKLVNQRTKQMKKKIDEKLMIGNE